MWVISARSLVFHVIVIVFGGLGVLTSLSSKGCFGGGADGIRRKSTCSGLQGTSAISNQTPLIRGQSSRE